MHGLDALEIAEKLRPRNADPRRLGGDLFRRERNLTPLTELGRLVMPMVKECYEGRLVRLIGRIAHGAEELPAFFGLDEAADIAKR